MTVYKNPRKAPLVNPQQCYTGSPASSPNLGASMQQAFTHLRNWRSGEFIAHYAGRPDEAVNGNATAGTTSSYYIITGFPAKHDTSDPDRNLIAIVQNWEKGYSGAVNEAWKWYKTAGGALTQTLWDEYAHGTGVTDDTKNVKPSGTAHHFGSEGKPMLVTPTASNDGFQVSKLTSDYALTASLVVFSAPVEDSLELEQIVAPLGNFYPGETLRGYDGDEGRSVGAVAHLIDAGDSVVHNTRRVMFQTCYPLGCRNTGTAGWVSVRADSATNPYTYRVKPSNLNAGTSLVDCLPALVITADSGAEIRYIDTTSGENWTYTSAGDSAALIHASDGVSSRAGYVGMPVTATAYSEIEVQITGNTKDVTIHTASLWGPSTGR